MSDHSVDERLAVVDIPSNVLHYVLAPGGTGPLETMTREQVRAGGGGQPHDCQVTSFELRDGMSELGGLDVQFIVSAGASIASGSGGEGRTPDPVVGALLGQPVMFAWVCGTEQNRHHRYFHGIVVNIGETGGDARATLYRAMVVPRVWRMTLGVKSRIFQKKSTVDIIKQVLSDDYDLQDSTDADFAGLTETYEPRQYCVQYRETDFDFLSRLMEEDGIAYFFDHTEERDVMHFVDAKTVHHPCLPFDAVVVQQPDPSANAGPGLGAGATEETVARFYFSHTVAPGQVMVRDYDFENSEQKPSGTAQGICRGEPTVYEYPGRFLTDDQGSRYALIRQEELDARTQVAHGESTVRSLAAGRTFEVVDHARESFRQVYLCTAVTHVGTDEGVVDGEGRPLGAGGATYENSLECIPVTTQFRPPRVRPKPVIVGVQTARVVGPPDEEIHTDEFMRIQVKFHWDLDENENEDASCWIRIVQPSADSGFGTSYIPRVGTEVLVEFEEGDPDRPIINGALYNDRHMPALDLPGKKMQTGVKSNSTPGGGGNNEILMDDTKDKEQLSINAQYDMSTTVGHDQSLAVTNNRSSNIDVDDAETVGSNQTVDIGTDQTISIGSNQSLSVGADQSETVGANQTVDIGSNQTITVGADQSITVGANLAASVGGNEEVSIGGDETATVGGARSVTIGADDTLSAGANLKIDAGANIEQNAGADLKLTSGAATEISAGSKITISAGGSSIEIGPDGIKITSGAIITVTGSTIKLN